MKKNQKKAALMMTFILLCGNFAGCAPEELYKFMQQGRQAEESAGYFTQREEESGYSKEVSNEQKEGNGQSLDSPGQQEEENGQIVEPPNLRNNETGQVTESSNQMEEEGRKEGQEAAQRQEQVSTGKYAYEQLGKSEQTVYDEMLAAILDQEEKVKLSTIDTEIMQRAYTAICSDYGGLFWVDGYVYTRYTKGKELVSLEFSPKYTMTQEERKDMQDQIDGIVEIWLTGISQEASDYEKAKYIYELLAMNTKYVKDAQDNQNIISVFIRQQTVCQGYACAVQYLMGKLGIQSVIVSGKAMGEPHAWNLICLDGDYYYMDATWGNNGYENKEGVETPFINYNFMAMTTEEMLMGHQPNEELELPECSAILNNYYRKEGNYIEEWDPDGIGMILAAAWEERRVITLRFSDESLKEMAFQYFIQEGHLADYCSEITQINYIEDSQWKEISFCFNQS